MTDASKVFDGNNQEQSGGPDNAKAPGNQQSSFIESLVGDGKKYATTEDLAKSRVHADEHISKLEEENAKLRGEVEKAKAREELMEELKQQRGADNAPAQANTPAETITADQIDKRIDDVLSQRTASERAAANLEKAAEAVYAIHGDKSPDFMEQKAAELGVGVEFLKQTGAQSPAALLSILGISEAPAVKREADIPPSNYQGNPSAISEQKRLEEIKAVKKTNSRAFYQNWDLQQEYHELKKKLKQ